MLRQVIPTARELDHVLWIGGTPCAGKSTLATVIAREHHVETYHLDQHGAGEARSPTGPAVRWWASHTMDERWLDQSAADLLERSVACWEESFPIALADLAARRSRRPLIVEGPGALPWLVAPVVSDRRRAIFFIADLAFRDRVVAEREARGISPVAYSRTSDPDRARANHRERDRRLMLRIEASCRELGLTSLAIRESRDLERASAFVEEHFAVHLPKALNV